MWISRLQCLLSTLAQGQIGDMLELFQERSLLLPTLLLPHASEVMRVDWGICTKSRLLALVDFITTSESVSLLSENFSSVKCPRCCPGSTDPMHESKDGHYNLLPWQHNESFTHHTFAVLGLNRWSDKGGDKDHNLHRIKRTRTELPHLIWSKKRHLFGMVLILQMSWNKCRTSGKSMLINRVFTIDVPLLPSYVINIYAIDQVISFCYLISLYIWIFLQE